MMTKGKNKAINRRQFRRREKNRDRCESARGAMLGHVARRSPSPGRGCPKF